MRRALAGCAVLVLGVVAAAAAKEGGPVGVLKVRLGGDAHQTRVVIELDHSVQGRMIASDSKGRITVALPQAETPGGMQGQGAGLVKAWAVEDGAGGARIKLDLVRPASVVRRFLLAPGDGTPVYRYVIDLSEIVSTAPPAPVKAAAPMASPSLSLSPIRAALQPPTPAKKVIVIDAGHGGKDPGAAGADAREKDLTLAAARALRDRLQRSGRYKVVLTRDTDVFIPLERRVQIARRANADLFISLHADSGGDAKVRGATVYTLSDHGVDRTAKSVFGGGFIDVQLPGRDLSVKQILLDLTQRTTRNRSGAFAETLLQYISTRTELLRRSHRDAGYMVLLAPDVPAVLLEMGFITNPADEANLNDPERRGRLMDGVAEAIETYFADNPVKVATAE